MKKKFTICTGFLLWSILVNGQDVLKYNSYRFIHVAGGGGNTSLGINAGVNLSLNSTYNTIVGQSAGSSTTSASFNAFFGTNAGYYTTGAIIHL